MLSVSATFLESAATSAVVVAAKQTIKKTGVRYRVMEGLSGALDSDFLFLRCPDRPRHARCVVGDAQAALGVEQNHSAVAVDALFQVVHRFLRDPLRQTAGFH